MRTWGRSSMAVWIAGRKRASCSGSPFPEALCDPTWEVRRAAGLALHDVGAPGHLMLRRTLASEDRFAADMAELVLALPDRDPGSG